jgi:hypothetical protein
MFFVLVMKKNCECLTGKFKGGSPSVYRQITFTKQEGIWFGKFLKKFLRVILLPGCPAIEGVAIIYQ